MKIVLFFATKFFVQMTFAAMIVASYGNSPVDKNLSTRILVVGRGKELYYLLQEAAIAKAHKLKEVFPSDQIVLVTVAETGLSENKNFLRTRSFQPLSESSNDFTPDRLLTELLKWKKIESIDFYTHNSAHLGMQLEDADTRFGINYTQFAQLKSNLTKESYIILQGCNTGFWLAPNMSKWLGIPVAGSLTGTNVHHLHSNGFFFDFDEPKKPVGPWADLNSSSYQQPVSCKNGGCLRTKPDKEVYAGTWGNFSGGGLPI